MSSLHRDTVFSESKMANYVGNKFGQADHEKLVNFQLFPCLYTQHLAVHWGLGLAFFVSVGVSIHSAYDGLDGWT